MKLIRSREGKQEEINVKVIIDMLTIRMNKVSGKFEYQIVEYFGILRLKVPIIRIEAVSLLEGWEKVQARTRKLEFRGAFLILLTSTNEHYLFSSYKDVHHENVVKTNVPPCLVGAKKKRIKQTSSLAQKPPKRSRVKDAVNFKKESMRIKREVNKLCSR